jgi:hypothetical protein
LELCDSAWKGDLENVRKIFTLPESIYVVNYLNERGTEELSKLMVYFIFLKIIGR